MSRRERIPGPLPPLAARGPRRSRVPGVLWPANMSTALLPPDMAGLFAWLDAAPAYITLAAGRVSQWDVRAGSYTGAFSQATATKQPGYQSTGFGTKNTPYASFVHTRPDQLISTTNCQPCATANTLCVMAVKRTDLASDGQIWYSHNDSLGYVYPDTAGTALLAEGHTTTGSGFAVATTWRGVNSYTVIALGYDFVAGQSVFRRAGGAVERLVSVAGVSGAAAPLYLGTDNASAFATGFDVAEIAFWRGFTFGDDSTWIAQMDAMRLRHGTE